MIECLHYSIKNNLICLFKIKKWLIHFLFVRIYSETVFCCSSWDRSAGVFNTFVI